MLDEKMGSSDLALGDTGNGTGTRTSAVVGGHVVLELFGVGAGGGFPSRQLLGRVEVVGEVLGVGVSDLPARRKTGVSLEGVSELTEEAEVIHGSQWNWAVEMFWLRCLPCLCQCWVGSGY